MNKYVYAECPLDYWPSLHTIMGVSYNDAVEKLIMQYQISLEDDKISEFDNIKALQEYLNNTYALAISDLEDIDEL